MRRSHSIRLALALSVLALGPLACDRGTIMEPADDDDIVTPVTASGWVSSVDWDQRTVIDVAMVEDGASLSYLPNTFTFEAGSPYVLRITNSASNSSKHYFSPDGFESFFQAIATRKIQTEEAEYKAPYFDAVELKVGGTLEIYFVPVLAGEYDIYCSITGHKEAGMTASVSITGGEGYALDLEVAPDFNVALANDARRSGGHAVWEDAIERTVSMVEGQTDFAFEPPDLPLTAGIGYELTLDNPAGNDNKHYYAAPEFYRTVVLRKADDDDAEVKAPYLNAVELLVEGSTTLFIVPTDSGTFEVECTIPGHAEAGMVGTIRVSTAQATPTKASDWVGFVDWDQRTIVEVEMVEGGDRLSFAPDDFTFEAGQPYVLRITNAVSNDSKHYFSPDGAESFFQAVATRKVQTSHGEYKAPYFDAVELKVGGALEIFFVPVLAGEYDIWCSIPGHKEAGMTATVTIVGGDGFELDLEVAPDFDTGLMTDERRSGSHAVWGAAEDLTVSMYEAPDFTSLGFEPPEITLASGTGYRLELANPSTNSSKHYYTATEFYKTTVLRKADDPDAEIKAPYLNAVELLIGGSTTLFVVPTTAGSFPVICTIVAHADLGMTGTIDVSSGS